MRLPSLRSLARVPALRLLPAFLVGTCLLLDLRATTAWHAALSRSGGLVDHSDATHYLAYDIRYGGLGAPIVLDWGLDAPVRFLSGGTVTPIEVFGDASLLAPDETIDERLAPFLDNANNVYLLRTPGNELFRGRRAAFQRPVEERSGHLERERVYSLAGRHAAVRALAGVILSPLNAGPIEKMAF